jgi:2-hydroxy-3-keto-5-methylthiopentenyl-1-phosphate phosphatase
LTAPGRIGYIELGTAIRKGRHLKTLVQCDFDGTITDRDVSFLLLDAFAEGDWQSLLEEYYAGRISVGDFNTRAFAMIKAPASAQLDLIFRSGKIKIRPGLLELVNYCKENGLKFVIVSNGQDFYIKAMLADLGLGDVEFHAAQAKFLPEGMDVHYIGPDGNIVLDGFKEAYARYFLGQGYRLLYVGNGASDIFPARLAQRVFATGEMRRKCAETGLDCIPFEDLHDVVKGMEKLPPA